MDNLIKKDLTLDSGEAGENFEKIKIGEYLLDYIDLLELASKMSYEVTKHGLDNLLSIVDFAKLIAPKNKNILFLENSVRQTIIKNFINSLPTEFDIQNMARDKIHKVLEGAKVIKKKNHVNNQPDLWIEINGKDIPVEVKLGKFDLKALKQLERYMDFYKTEEGVGIARELTVKLPKNIKFVYITELEETSQ